MSLRALLRVSADISGKSQLPMFHMLCNTSKLLKIAQTCCISTGHYIITGSSCNYGFVFNIVVMSIYTKWHSTFDRGIVTMWQLSAKN